jgi:hypothetical protein
MAQFGDGSQRSAMRGRTVRRCDHPRGAFPARNRATRASALRGHMLCRSKRCLTLGFSSLFQQIQVHSQADGDPYVRSGPLPEAGRTQRGHHPGEGLALQTEHTHLLRLALTEPCPWPVRAGDDHGR